MPGANITQAKPSGYYIISTFFLLFLILLWKLTNRDKWVKTYEEVGNRPWLYPANTTIKNPLKRFKNRLFKK